MQDVLVPVSIGELIDKITILEIKRDRIIDPAKHANVCAELDALLAILATLDAAASPEAVALRQALHGVNLALWNIEDDIRECERAKAFGERFIELARAVYFTNDTRAGLKRQLNTILGSRLVEEKSYRPYD